MINTIPHDENIEKSILASCILDRNDLSFFVEEIIPENFYQQKHQVIFKGLIEWFTKNNAVDLPLLAMSLKENKQLDNIGGAAYLASLLDFPICINNSEYVEKLKELSTKRRLLETGYKLMKDAQRPDIPSQETIDAAEKVMLGVNHGQRQTTISMKDLAISAMGRYEAMQADNAPTGIMSQYYDLDKLLLGFRPGALYILAARPAMGKTALALNMAWKIANENIPAAIFSLEMSRDELFDRLISIQAQINTGVVRGGGKISDENWGKVNTAAAALHDLPLFIDDTPGLSYQSIIRRARRMVAKHGVKIIFVDYLQLMTGDKKNGRVEEISSISRNLKLLAKDLCVPVIALSQLSRECEKRPNKRPMLSDLRDSGAIEQDADAVMFIYRDEIYNPNTTEKCAELSLSKNRSGQTGVIRLTWMPKFTAFENASTQIGE